MSETMEKCDSRLMEVDAEELYNVVIKYQKQVIKLEQENAELKEVIARKEANRQCMNNEEVDRVLGVEPYPEMKPQTVHELRARIDDIERGEG